MRQETTGRGFFDADPQFRRISGSGEQGLGD
jgi:hypothetical protein